MLEMLWAHLFPLLLHVKLVIHARHPCCLLVTQMLILQCQC